MPSITVLGIGNRLWADEGFGPAVVDCLSEQKCLPPEVRLLDGGTLGLYLLPEVQETECLLVIDTVDFGDTEGALVVMRDGEIPTFFGQRPLSLHQTAFTDVLAAAQLTGISPQRITLIGLQPSRIDAWGEPLTHAARAGIAPAIELAVKEIHYWQQQERNDSCPPLPH